MYPSLKFSAALLVNFSILSTEVIAVLPPITFDEPEWTPLELVNGSNQTGWESYSGTSDITPAGLGFGGGMALRVKKDTQAEAWLSKKIEWDPAEATAFIDFKIKPAADPAGSLANFLANGSQLAFQVTTATPTAGEIWVFHGDDAVPSPVPDDEYWIKSPGTYSVPVGATTSATWLRITLRHDYERNVWDLFIDGKLAAANLGFDGHGDKLESLEFFGSKAGDTLVDDLSANPQNMLFPDADKDGLPDAWEDANGSNKNLYDRDAINTATGKSFLNDYLNTLWTPGLAVNGFAPPSPPEPGAVPPISILKEHQVVGALKGQFGVGGDGAATYTIPIDIPKGRAGMEPQISLNYSSNSGNGTMGVGWSLGGLQRITRGPSNLRKDGISDGVDFDGSDRYFLDGQRLVCISTNKAYGANGAEYRTEMDTYSRIISHGADGQGPLYWTVETKAGLKLTLGRTADARIRVPDFNGAGSAGVSAWLVNLVEDTTGDKIAENPNNDTNSRNGYVVEYFSDNNTPLAAASDPSRYPARVRYTVDPSTLDTATGRVADQGFCSVEFIYGGRPDTTSGYLQGFQQVSTKRLNQIEVRTAGTLNHRYNLDYTVSQQTGRPLLNYVDKEAADGSRIPGTCFEWDTLTHAEPKWEEVGQLDFNEYGSGQDSGSDMASFVSVSETDPTELRLTGNAWRTYPISYNATANTKLTFEYKSSDAAAGGLPKWAMIGLDENTSTGNPKRLFKLVGSGTTPVPTYTSSSYDYTFTPGQWQPITINVGQNYTGQMNFLALVSDDNQVSNGAGESYFRNIKIYESSQNVASVQPLVFEQALASPRIISGDNQDLGVRVQDLDSDGLPDIAYNLLYAKTTATGPVTLSTFGQVLRNTGSEFVNSTQLKLPSILPTATLPGGGEGTWASSQAIIPVPLDINGDGRVDYAYPRGLSRDGTQWSYEHGYMTWDGSAWVDMPGHVHKFWSWCDSSQKRFSHLEHVDLDSDGDLDVVVHPYGAKLYLYNGSRTQTLLLTGNGGSNLGLAYLNKHDEFNASGQPIGWEVAPKYRLPEQLRIPGFNSNNGEVGRGLQDLDGDGRPDIYSNLWPNPDEVWHNDPTPTNTSFWIKQLPVDSNPNNFVPPLTSLPEDVTNTNGEDIGTRLVDVNGDGFVDLIKALGSSSMNLNVGVYLNKGGRGWYKVASGHGGPWAPEENFNTVDKRGEMKEQGTSFVDLNADGLADFVVSKTTRNTIFFNTGSTWWAESDPSGNGKTFWATGLAGSGSTTTGKWELPSRIYPNTVAATEGIRHAMLVDLNGDGVSDLIGDMKNAVPKIWINKAKPERIVSFLDGFGSHLVVDEYRRLNDPTPLPYTGKRVYEKGSAPTGQAAIQDGRWVVARYSEPDGRGGRRYRSQRYGDLRSDNINDVSLGFGWIEVHDELTGAFTRSETRRDYPFAGSPSRVRSFIHVAETMDHEPGVTTGLKQVSEEFFDYGELAVPVSTGSGSIKRPVQTYSISRKWDFFRKVDANLNVIAEGNLLSKAESFQPVANYNQDGFLLQSTVTALDGSQTLTTNSYYPRDANPPKWILGRLQQTQVVKSAPNTPNITKRSSFAYDGHTGLLVTETIHDEDAVAPDLTVSTNYEHDDYGNVEYTRVTASGETRKSKTEFSTAPGYHARFPTAEISYLGDVAEEYLRVTHAYETTRALLLSTTDADLKTTTFGYDGFGTQTTVNYPTLTSSVEITRFAANSYLPAQVRDAMGAGASIRWARSAQSSGTPWATVYFDGLGRELVKESVVMTDGSGPTPVFENQYSVTRYDSRGRVEATSNPFILGDPVYWTEPVYDCLDRVIMTTRPDGATDKTVLIKTEGGSANNPLVHTVVRNPRGNELERWTDQHGRLSRSSDESGQITYFNYDAENRVTVVSIGSAPQMVNRWDGMGNKTGVWDLSSGVPPPPPVPGTTGTWDSGGTSSLIYNGFGEVRFSINALRHETETRYDGLGRVTKVIRPNGEGTFDTVYKEVAPAKGAPWKVFGSNGYFEEIKYSSSTSAWGQVEETSKRKSASDSLFIAKVWYNALGLVSATMDAGGVQVTNYYDSVYGSFPVENVLESTHAPDTTIWRAGSTTHTTGISGDPVFRSTETLAHGISRITEHDARNGRIRHIESTGLGRGTSSPLQKLSYNWDLNGNLLVRNDQVNSKSESFAYDTLDRLHTSTIGTSVVDYTYATNGNLLAKGTGKTLDTYSGYQVTQATIKGATRGYTYNAAGHVTDVTDLTTPTLPGGSAPRTYQWTSLGQLKWASQVSCPALETFAQTGTYAPQIPGIPMSVLHQPSLGTAAFEFDAGGSRAKQVFTRTFSNQSTSTCITDYVGSYERERTETLPFNGVPTLVKTLHRHQLGSTLFTRELDSATPGVRLAVVLTDHIGSTDVIIRAELSAGTWQTLSGNPRSERQSFDAWGERRAGDNWTELRSTDGSSRFTSSMDYDRGFTGHEMLDDFGLVHMNGRIYDPELGRFLSPDPYVQVPEYSQNFNRYSYVLNNPLSYTDPTGHFTVGLHYVAATETERYLMNHPDVAQAVNVVAGVVVAIITQNPSIGAAVTGALNARLEGGDFGEVLKSATISYFSAELAGALGVLEPVGSMMSASWWGSFAIHTAGHGIVGGLTTAALGGKFEDGFISAAVSAAAFDLGIDQALGLGKSGDFLDSARGASDYAKLIGRTAVAAAIGGTASTLGGGKFSNGAATGAFYHLANGEGAYEFLTDTDWHHMLPRQFKAQFEAAGLDIHSSKYGLMLDPEIHRGKGGIHPDWNRNWEKFFKYHKGSATKSQILRHLRWMKSSKSPFYEKLKTGRKATLSYGEHRQMIRRLNGVHLKSKGKIGKTLLMGVVALAATNPASALEFAGYANEYVSDGDEMAHAQALLIADDVGGSFGLYGAINKMEEMRKQKVD